MAVSAWISRLVALAVSEAGHAGVASIAVVVLPVLVGKTGLRLWDTRLLAVAVALIFVHLHHPLPRASVLRSHRWFRSGY